ncbi:hypothetical protein [Zavarzinella formosa]|uniref:hypothetical protein n=1 Tax=Zavarzinella formosa TaxID=360055 RepID=UPI0003166063|nr:hypothetical protein [Zavarzinella formosa]
MAKVDSPYVGLVRFGREWAPSIFFTRDRDRAEFLRLAGWLCQRFRAEVIDRYGGEEAESKEYWTLRVGESDWLLMRCFCPGGISLDGKHQTDLPAFEAIAREVGASPVGWRYRWVRLRRWLGGNQA